MQVQLITSTICKTKSVKNGVPIYEISGNEFNGVHVHENGTQSAKMGRAFVVGKTKNIKAATKWIKEAKKLGSTIVVEATPLF